jgi:hypothetical protein
MELGLSPERGRLAGGVHDDVGDEHGFVTRLDRVAAVRAPCRVLRGEGAHDGFTQLLEHPHAAVRQSSPCQR